MVIFVYFENIIFNFLIIVGLIGVSALLNYYLNKHARFLMKYTSSLKMNSKEIVEKYCKDKKVRIESFPSNDSNDLDSYLDSNKCIFINARHYFQTSLYTLSRTLYFCVMSEVEKNNPKAYKFQNKVDSFFALIDVLAWGLIMVGLLMKINVLIIIGLTLIVISFIFTFISFKVVKQYQNLAKEYLIKITKEKNEVNVISVIYRFELYQYLLKPLLSIVKIFPFLLSINQKKMSVKENYYED